MHIHILGICGTFMGGIAALARAAGHQVSGSDANVYPPMSTQLEQLGIELQQGYDPSHLQPHPDCVVIGNAMSRGNAAVEYVLNAGLPYRSGPQWLAEHVLNQRWVLAAAGTHGKTTTSSILAWILEYAGLKPGFLIGGIPGNFGISARLGEGQHFVVEADEYDTAFFDKRSKFVHYQPKTAILNNLEFDHADIFDDLPAIQRQFHHLVRTIPGQGRILSKANEPALEEVLQQGCWSDLQRFAGGDWQAKLIAADGSQFEIQHAQQTAVVTWSLLGQHNVDNALAAIAAAHHAGVDLDTAAAALATFEGIKRRLEVRGKIGQTTVYDDFAHHPTAIETTLAGLRARVGAEKIVAILEPRSNTMRLGIHKDSLPASLAEADAVHMYVSTQMNWQPETALPDGRHIKVHADTQRLVDEVVSQCGTTPCHLLVMSNGGFENVHQRLLDTLPD